MKRKVVYSLTAFGLATSFFIGCFLFKGSLEKKLEGRFPISQIPVISAEEIRQPPYPKVQQSYSQGNSDNGDSEDKEGPAIPERLVFIGSPLEVDVANKTGTFTCITDDCKYQAKLKRSEYGGFIGEINHSEDLEDDKKPIIPDGYVFYAEEISLQDLEGVFRSKKDGIRYHARLGLGEGEYFGKVVGIIEHFEEVGGQWLSATY